MSAVDKNRDSFPSMGGLLPTSLGDSASREGPSCSRRPAWMDDEDALREAAAEKRHLLDWEQDEWDSHYQDRLA